MTPDEIAKLLSDIAQADPLNSIVDEVTVRTVARTEGGLECETEITVHMKERTCEGVNVSA